MATMQERERAFDIFTQQLGAPPDTGKALAAFLGERYQNEIGFADRDTLLSAVSWAAAQIRSQFDVAQLTFADFDQIAQSLIHGCPLCATSTSGSSRFPSPSGSRTGGSR